MRKLFLLIPALLLSLMLKAADQYPDPAVDNSLAAAVSAVGNNEVIYLDEGTYTNSAASDYTKIRGGKHITFKAIEGKNPVVQLKYSFQIREASTAKFIGIKFDGTSLAYDSYFLLYDATDNTWEFKDCEFTALSKYIISVSTYKKAASIVFDSCYFHNITKSCVLIENTGESNLTVTNCTFANIDASAVSAGVVDSRTATGVITVDHCTFYNCKVHSTDYGTVRVTSPNATVSNCIFAMPTSTDNLRTVYVADGIAAGTTVTHCLMHNYTKDSNLGIPSRSGLHKIECNVGDPLFNDLANNKYTYAGTYGVSMSPARGASTDKSDLGDPRWYTPVIYPTTDFAGGYAFTANKAELSGNIIYETGAPEPQSPYLRYNHSWKPGVAEWVIKATRACYVSATVNMADNTWNYDAEDNERKYFQNHKHIFIVELRDTNDNLLDSLQEGEHEGDGSSDGWSTYPTVNLQGTIHIPAAGVYTIKLKNNRNESRCGVNDVTLSYVGGEVQSMPGTTNINDAWFSAEGTRADGNIDFPNSTIQNGWVKWNVAFENTASHKVTVYVNSNNCKEYTVALQDENGADLVTPLTKSDCSTTGSNVALEMGTMVVPAGNYILKVTNGTKDSDAKLIGVKFEYYGGGTVNIPTNTVSLNEAILNGGATRDGDGLHFKNDQYVVWNIHATEGVYTFSATCTSSNYSNLTIKVKQGANEIYTHTPQYTYTGDKVISSPQWILDAGDYTLELYNPTSGSGYVTALAATAAEGYFILNDNKADDGSIAAANYNETTHNVKYNVLLKRSFSAGKYYTLCVPFDSYDSELTSKFGTEYEVWKMVSAEQVGEEINLNFEQIAGNDFAAGVPYLIKPTIDVENPVFSDKKIRNYTGNNVKSCNAADFVGSFYKSEIPAGENNLYLQNNELFYNENNNTPIKGTRAWVRLKPQGGAASAPKARIVLKDNMTTAIETVNSEKQTLKTIENGQIVIIRDGQKYNVMGVKLQ